MYVNFRNRLFAYDSCNNRGVQIRDRHMRLVQRVASDWGLNDAEKGWIDANQSVSYAFTTTWTPTSLILLSDCWALLSPMYNAVCGTKVAKYMILLEIYGFKYAAFSQNFISLYENKNETAKRWFFDLHDIFHI